MCVCVCPAKSSFQCMYVQVGTLILPSPRNSDWLSAEPSSQSHLRREARSSLAAYLRTMVRQSQHLLGAICRQQICDLPVSGFRSSCWNRWVPLSSSASSSTWATVRFTTKPQQKSGRSEDPTLQEVFPPFSPGLDHGQPSLPSMRIRPEQYRWRWISFAVFICPPATSQLTCSTCFIFRPSQPERTFTC